MQTGPGDVDYRSLIGLDFVIAQAQAYGEVLRVLPHDRDQHKSHVGQMAPR